MRCFCLITEPCQSFAFPDESNTATTTITITKITARTNIESSIPATIVDDCNPDVVVCGVCVV